MKKFKLITFALVAFVVCFLSGCDNGFDAEKALSVNKEVFDFGTEGGKDMLIAKTFELCVAHIRVIERATNKTVLDSALVQGKNVKEIVVDGKTFCKLDYNGIFVSRLMFDWCTLTAGKIDKDGRPLEFLIEMAKPNPQKYIIELGMFNMGRPYFVSIK